ncbi:MAG: tRNA (adenosine(37)-N6)-threonylcarbamoyltransferase complex transferase subunit TsaD [Puniceicoccaceae bacterium]
MILGIESSCDESAVALFDPERGVVGNWLQSQITLHREFGGVVPELATREHLASFPDLLQSALNHPDFRQPEAVAVTRGPGLAGCLAVGLSVAKALAIDFQIPVHGVNHLRAHALSPFIPIHQSSPAIYPQQLNTLLPHLGLVVSGGNTLLIRLDPDCTLTVLAETVDDAAGEALDKAAKLLGLPYPGGPEIEKMAQSGDPRTWDFPRAFEDPRSLAFSFSGLKTSLRYRLEKMPDDPFQKALPDLCASYQEAVVDQLIRKMRQVLPHHPVRSLGLSGGVSNNRRLKERFTALASDFQLPHLIAPSIYSGDNAAMIAFAAWMDDRSAAQIQTSYSPDGLDLGIDPSLPIDQS